MLVVQHGLHDAGRGERHGVVGVSLAAQDALWERLGIGPAGRELLKGRRLDPGAERVLFALVANRARAPSSKLAASRWAGEDVLITGLPTTSDDACYPAMDWLLQIREALEKRVFDGRRSCSASRSTCCSSTPPAHTS
jgi:hypothetical protein